MENIRESDYRESDDNSHEIMTESDEKSLIELEKERRRIISNQTVRRKTIDKWMMIDADSILSYEQNDVNDHEACEYDFEYKFMDNFSRFKKLEVNGTQNSVSAGLVPQNIWDGKIVSDNRQKVTSPETTLTSFPLIDSIDTSSIIENKSVTKEYWEKRMIADQELISFDCIPNDDDTNTQLINTKMKTSSGHTNLNQTQKTDKTFGVTGINGNGKLGSDGESEASPESSLSPVDVDSLEGSDGRQSPEGEASSEQSETSHHDINSSLSPCEESNTIDNELFQNDYDRDICLAFERNERNELSTVLEEEQEPDSLEEFIKHESECMQYEDENMAKESKFQGDSSKEVLYEEIIDNTKLDSQPHCADVIVADSTKLAAGNLLVSDQCNREPKMGSIFSQFNNDQSNGHDIAPDHFQYADEIIINGNTELNNNNTFDKYEDTIAIEDTVTQPKPQIIGETYHNDTTHESALTGIAATKTSIKTLKNKTVNPAELKIASEIKEIKEREEELRKIREKLNVKQVNGNISLNHHEMAKSDNSFTNSTDTFVQNNATNDISLENHPMISDSNKIGNSESIMRALSNDTYGKTQKQMPLTNEHEKLQSQLPVPNQKVERIKVKPLSDDDESNNKSLKNLAKESPIEREIRIATEREEELRREKLRLSSHCQNGSALINGASSPTCVNSTSALVNGNNKLPVFKQNSAGVINVKDTQKLLATTRIQQEIEEQTQREMALRAIGSIQTLSQERTDAKVTKLGEMERNGINRSVSSIEQSPSIESPSPIDPVDGNYALHRFPSSASSTSSSANYPALCRQISSPSIMSSKGSISMHKFINSKGKAAAKDNSFSPFTSSNGNLINGSQSNDYHELKPPQFAKSNMGTLRRHVSAECKIKEELKQMKAREDELRNQRIRLLGLSHPNLNALIDIDDDDDGRISDEDKCKMIRNISNSNPNLIDDRNGIEQKDHNSEGVAIGGPRRRIALIAQWEQKIQKEIKIKN